MYTHKELQKKWASTSTINKIKSLATFLFVCLVLAGLIATINVFRHTQEIHQQRYPVYDKSAQTFSIYLNIQNVVPEALNVTLEGEIFQYPPTVIDQKRRVQKSFAIFIFGGADQVVYYPKNSLLSSFIVSLRMSNGTSADYPFDNYDANCNIQVEFVDDTSGSNLDFELVMESRLINGFKAAFPDPKDAARTHVALGSKTIFTRMNRAAVFKLYPVFIIVGMWAIATVTFSLAAKVAIFRSKKAELPMLIAYSTITFALPLFRGSAPLAPPIGCLMDWASFFWAELVVIVGFCSIFGTVIMQKVQPAPPPSAAPPPVQVSGPSSTATNGPFDAAKLAEEALSMFFGFQEPEVDQLRHEDVDGAGLFEEDERPLHLEHEDLIDWGDEASRGNLLTSDDVADFRNAVEDNVWKPVQAQVLRPLEDNVFRPVQAGLQENVWRPMQDNVFKPMQENVWRPVQAGIEEKLLRPVEDRVLRPMQAGLEEKLWKPMQAGIQDKLLKPMEQQLFRPMQEQVFRPMEQFFRPVHNTVFRPLTDAITTALDNPEYWEAVAAAQADADAQAASEQQELDDTYNPFSIEPADTNTPNTSLNMSTISNTTPQGPIHPPLPQGQGQLQSSPYLHQWQPNGPIGPRGPGQGSNLPGTSPTSDLTDTAASITPFDTA